MGEIRVFFRFFIYKEVTMKKNTPVQMMQIVVYITQFGISLALPLVLCLWGANWLQTRYALGSWIFIPAIILGLGGAASSFVSFAKYFKRHNQK